MTTNAAKLLKTLKSMADNGRYLNLVDVRDTEALTELKTQKKVTIDNRGPGWPLEVYPE